MLVYIEGFWIQDVVPAFLVKCIDNQVFIKFTI
jgi:hypothetical protein